MTQARVTVVADSTCYLPTGWAERFGIVVVPVQVVIGGQSYDETDDERALQVIEALRDRQLVTTSRPTPVSFLRAYREAESAGATGVVVVTLSAEMSATHDSAVVAAKEAGLPVEVVDSRSVAMGLGFAAVTAARVAAAGGSLGRVADAARQRAALLSVLFYVDDLEYLRRGGRIGGTRAAVGQLLQVKPLLQVLGGRVESLEQVRTAGRAIARLADLAVETAGADPVDISVQHLASPDRAADLARTLRERLPSAEVIEGVVGGVVGAHVGPGLLAVVVAPRVDESPADHVPAGLGGA